MGETEDFNTLAFEKRLMQLKDTQESIQSLSAWCLRQRVHHKKIVSSWLNVLKRVKVEQRLVLFYLANDVIQYSKRKHYEFVESWGLNLQKATPLVRDEKVRPKILRIFKIWEQRSVYDDEFLSDLTGLLSAGAQKKADDDALDFQPQQLVNKIKQCAVLEADTDLRLKYIHDSHLQLSDADALCANLKDRSHKDDVEKELNEGIVCVERYTQALQREIVAREALLALLSSATQYYSTQRGEVKVVAYAYKNFGARVRSLKRKLDEVIPTLPDAAPSPPRDEDVPSPGPDEDLDLPANDDDNDHDAYNIDQTFNSTLGADGSLYNLGLSSFLTSENPMALFTEAKDNVTNTNKIEVINTRPSEKQDFNINDFLKTLVTNDNNNASDNVSVGSASMSQKSQDTLPGLDLLSGEGANPPPPTSFYGTMEPPPVSDEPEQSYLPEANNTWSGSNLWNAAPVAPGSFPEAPESPPLSERTAFPIRASNELGAVVVAADVDHRGLLPPPPPPPVLPLLGQMEDVDHRMLPALGPAAPVPAAPPPRHTAHQDVDHRNLIALTHEPPVEVAGQRSLNSVKMDQDYRVPPSVAPTDIVESVDMDLSEDEEQHGLYNHMEQHPPELARRHSFNNNKVLVGGDNGKTNSNDQMHTNFIQVQNIENKEPQSTPVLPAMANPFDTMQTSHINYNPNAQKFRSREFEGHEKKNDAQFDEDPRNRRIENPNQQTQMPFFKDYNESEWQGSPHQGSYMNQRFPRNWGPRPNFRMQGPPGHSGPPGHPSPQSHPAPGHQGPPRPQGHPASGHPGPPRMQGHPVPGHPGPPGPPRPQGHPVPGPPRHHGHPNPGPPRPQGHPAPGHPGPPIPQGPPPQQFWPRNGLRTPNRWNVQRPRFW